MAADANNAPRSSKKDRDRDRDRASGESRREKKEHKTHKEHKKEKKGRMRRHVEASDAAVGSVPRAHLSAGTQSSVIVMVAVAAVVVNALFGDTFEKRVRVDSRSR